MRPEDIPEKETVLAIPPLWVLTERGNRLATHQGWDTESDAIAFVDGATRGDWRERYTVRRATWQQREEVRPDHALNGPVWANEPWWTNGPDEVRNLHHVRVSTVDPTMLAYFQSPEKACLNIRTRIKPGRYLGKFFPHMPEAERAKMAKWQETGMKDNSYADEKAYPLGFATTRDEIKDVYENGPESCMSGKHCWSDNRITDNQHPAEVYAAGDLAIAYFKRAPDSTDYIARALCWPAQKVFGRVYPTATNQDQLDAYNAMTNRFLAMGWRQDDRSSFNGAKLLKIRVKGGWLMPYLDWGYRVSSASDEHWKMNRSGDREAGSTCGYIGAYDGDESYDDDDDDDDDRSVCDNCGDRGYSLYTVYTNARMTNEVSWCECCHGEHAFYCHGEREYFDENVSDVEVDGETYTLRYAENNFVRSDLSGDWICGDGVDMTNGETWSQDEFDDRGFTCVIIGDNHPNADRHPDYPDDDISDACTDAMILKWLEEEGRDDEAAELRAAINGAPATIPDERQILAF